MVKPNYSYEKRQKELAKERKKQEKLQRKANKTESAGAAKAPAPDSATGDAADAEAKPAA